MLVTEAIRELLLRFQCVGPRGRERSYAILRRIIKMQMRDSEMTVSTQHSECSECVCAEISLRVRTSRNSARCRWCINLAEKLPLDGGADSVNAAGHHVFIASAGCAAVSKAPGQIVGVEAFESLHVLGLVGMLDADQAI